MNIKDKNVLVVGMGRSGISAVKVLHDMGIKVKANDSKSIEEIDKDFTDFLKRENIPYSFGSAPETDGADLMVLSPGVPPSLPFVQEAEKKGIPVIGELELAYIVGKGNYIAITGTNGKTTTVTLVGDILLNAGKESMTVGNIGVAAVGKTVKGTEDTQFVTEVSSFQLETIKEFKPHISAILNITPDHLDRHGDMKTYASVKARIFENQTADDYVIVNYDDPLTMEAVKDAKAKVVPFSTKNQLDYGVFVKDGMIVIADEDYSIKVCKVSDIKIPGEHNLQNAVAAVAIAYCAGIETESIARTLKEFEGVEHRIEFCDNICGVDYYNDSKGTNPDAAIKALEALKENIILIAGGYDKNGDFTTFVKAFKGRVKKAVLLGATAKHIEAAAKRVGFENTVIVSDMESAVKEAAKDAVKGDKVLLSPACASWDMYTSYEERGVHFKECVRKMTGIDRQMPKAKA